MPLLKKQPFEPEGIPPDLGPESLVFFCPATKEVFRDYDEFFNRTILLNSLVWSCSVTGKANLTYEEAEESERASLERLGSFPDVLEAPVGWLVWRSYRGRIDDLLGDLWAALRSRYFPAETIETFTNGERQSAEVIGVHYHESPVCPSSSVDSDLNDSTSKKDKTKEELSLPEPSHYTYDLRFADGVNKKGVPAAQLFRSKNQISKTKLRLFIKNNCFGDVDKWSLKPHLVATWGLETVEWAQLLAGPEPTFPVSPMAKTRPSALTTPSKDDTPEARKEKKAAAARRKEERLLKDSKFIKAKEAQTAEVEMLAGQGRGVGMDDADLARWTDLSPTKLLKADDIADLRVAIKEARKTNKESLIEKRKKDKEALVEWKKVRDDLLCDDLKPLPPLSPLRLPPWLDPQMFSQALSFVEFAYAFKSCLHNDTCPLPKDTGALNWLLSSICDRLTSADNQYLQILVWLLSSLGQLQGEEDGDEASLEATKAGTQDDDLGGGSKGADAAGGAELERAGYLPAIRAANAASESTRLRFGASLRHLPLDHLAASESLRLAIAQAGYFQGQATARHRYHVRGGYRCWDDRLLQLRLHRADLVAALGAGSVLNLAPADKLELLDALSHQLLSYGRLRETHEKRLDSVRAQRSALKALERAEEKLCRDFKATQLERSYEQRLKEAFEDERALWEQEKSENPDNQPPPPSPPEIPPRPKASKETQKLRKWMSANEEALEANSLTEELITEEMGELAKSAELAELTDAEVARVRQIQEVLYRADKEALLADILDTHSTGGVTFLGRDRAFRRYCYSEIARVIFVEDGDATLGECETATPLDRVERSSGLSDAALRIQLLSCTGEAASCTVHKAAPQQFWHRLTSAAELEALRDGLNPRGARESELAESVAIAAPRLDRLLAKGPPTLFDKHLMEELEEVAPMEVDEEEDDEEDVSLSLTLDALPSLEERRRPPSLRAEMSEVVERLLDLEREMELGGLGSLRNVGVGDRNAWRESLERGRFRPQVDRLEVLGRDEPVWKEGQPSAGLKGLRLAILQTIRSLYLQCLEKPFVDAPDEPREDGVERVELASFIAWQQSVVETETPSQLALHLAAAQEAIIWSKSKLNARCRECRRKGEVVDGGESVDMVVCDACERCFHLACAKPKPLKAVPGPDDPPWACPDCKRKADKRQKKKKDKEAKASPPAAKAKPTKNGHVEKFKMNGHTSPKVEDDLFDAEESSNDSSSRLSARLKKSPGSSTSCPYCNVVVSPKRWTECEICTRGFHRQCAAPLTASGSFRCLDCESAASASSSRENSAVRTTKTGRVVKRKRAFDELPPNTRSPSPASPPPKEEAAAPKKKPKAADGLSEEELRELRMGLRGKGLSAGVVKRLQGLVEETRRRPEAWPFLVPVDPKAVPLYYQVISEPMDLRTMLNKLKRREYSQPSDLLRDARLIFANCRAFNEEDCDVAKCGRKLEKWILRRFREEGISPSPDSRKKP